MPDFIADDRNAIKAGLDRLEAERRQRYASVHEPFKLVYDPTMNAGLFLTNILNRHMVDYQLGRANDAPIDAKDVIISHTVGEVLDWLNDSCSKSAFTRYSNAFLVAGDQAMNVKTMFVRLRNQKLI